MNKKHLVLNQNREASILNRKIALTIQQVNLKLNMKSQEQIVFVQVHLIFYLDWKYDSKTSIMLKEQLEICNFSLLNTSV